jgi:hypothetical protein
MLYEFGIHKSLNTLIFTLISGLQFRIKIFGIHFEPSELETNQIVTLI